MNTEMFYPTKLSSSYSPASCLKSRPEEETWLCRDKQTGEKVIVKLAAGQEAAELLRNECALSERLRQLSSPAARRFPRVLHQGEEDGITYLVRTYVPGMSLQDYMETAQDGTGVSREEALRIIREVLTQVQLIHGLKPPIIHRDIGPKNVILDPEEGTVTLIDFGIARQFCTASKPQDTTAMGTFFFAPPEQYGFRQTDERSDLFAVGVLLRYCLTGECDPAADKEVPADLREVIGRATEFDPKNRYSSAGQMLSALASLEKTSGGGRGPGSRRLLAAAAAAALVLAGAGAFAYFGPGRPPVTAEETYDFAEPLLESAVRQQLGQEEGPITRESLEQITELHIFGKQIYTQEAEFLFQGEYVFAKDARYRESGLWEENGQIKSLKDLAAMPNLQMACLYRQEISDLSDLAGTRIPYLGLGYNPLTDLGPLEGNENIQGLNLSCLDLTDLSPLASLPGLEELVISGLGALDFSPLAGLPLRVLNISDSWPVEDTQLLAFRELEKIVLSRLYPGLLACLKELPLKDLETTHVQDITLRDLQQLPLLERLCYRTGQEELEELSAEPLLFPEMVELDMKGLSIESLTCLSDLTHLRRVGIYESQVQDYTGLAELSRLSQIWALPGQKEELDRLYPNAGWSIG